VLWTLADGRLTSIPVVTGISDSVNVAILSGDLSEGARVVTGVAAAASAPAPANGSPLMPTFPRRNQNTGARPAR
jgi:hypothetical protein